VVAIVRCSQCGEPVKDAIALCGECVPHTEVRQDVRVSPGWSSRVLTRTLDAGPTYRVVSRDQMGPDGEALTFEHIVDRILRRRIERKTGPDGEVIFVKDVDLDDQNTHGPAEARRQSRTPN
jgi:hypothetical protein